MRDAGVERRSSSARPSRTRSSRLANRTHRRVLVADGRVGMTGGVGIADEWTGDAEDPDHWRDTHVRVRGPVVRGLQGAFAENWLEATGEVLAGEGYLPDLEPVDGGGRCSSCAPAPRSATPTSRRSTTSRSPPRASRST